MLKSGLALFLVPNCETEIWGSYNWPVDSLTCLNITRLQVISLHQAPFTKNVSVIIVSQLEFEHGSKGDNYYLNLQPYCLRPLSHHGWFNLNYYVCTLAIPMKLTIAIFYHLAYKTFDFTKAQSTDIWKIVMFCQALLC